MSEDKKAKLLASLGKQFGKNVITTADKFPPVEFIKCGIPLVDWALTGGLPRGRIVEIWGGKSGGKTTLASLFISWEQQYQEQQEEPKEIFYFDRENTYNIPWTNKLGVNNSSLNLIRDGWDEKKQIPIFLTAEDVFNMTMNIVSSGLASIIVWDSLAAFVPRAKVEAQDAGKMTPGGLAAIMSRNMPELVTTLSKNNCTLIIVNQVREKIGVMYGNPQVRSGGMALEHYASQIIYVRMGDFFEAKDLDPETGAETGEKHRIGNESRIKVEKNKVGPCYREATVNYYYDYGVDRVSAVVDMALQLRVIEQGGRFYRHEAFSIPDFWEPGEDLVNVEKGYTEGKERIYMLARKYNNFLVRLKDEVDAKLSS